MNIMKLIYKVFAAAAGILALSSCVEDAIQPLTGKYEKPATYELNTLVSQSVEKGEKTRTFTVEVVVNNYKRELRPGMFARVEVNFGSNNRVVIPDVSVVKQQGSGERFVYVLNEDGTVSYQKVELGRRMGAEYEVISGLKDSSIVVTGGQIRLKDGVKVSVNK